MHVPCRAGDAGGWSWTESLGPCVGDQEWNSNGRLQGVKGTDKLWERNARVCGSGLGWRRREACTAHPLSGLSGPHVCWP